MQGKEVACLASIKQFLSNNKSIPSLAPSFYSTKIKTMTVRKPSLQEKHTFSTCNRLIRQSPQASICGKFQNGQEIWDDFLCICEIPSGMLHTRLTTRGKLVYSRGLTPHMCTEIAVFFIAVGDVY